MAFPYPLAITNISQISANSQQWDGIIYLSALNNSPLDYLDETLYKASLIDKRVGKEALLLACDEAPGGRVVHAPVGQLDRYYDDVRRYYDAAYKAALIARDAGMVKPVLLVDQVAGDAFANAVEVSYFGICQALWQPLEAREFHNESQIEPIEMIGVYADRFVDTAWMAAVEAGVRAARDVSGTEPERMSPINMANYCADLFDGSAVTMEVIEDRSTLETDYPLLAAVGRSSWCVERHAPRVVKLSYTGRGEITNTLLLAGKGLSYDTGGADLKVNGVMAGMSRDKGGGAAVIGLMKTIAELQPDNIRVIAEVGCVRNSIGSDAFVPDEIIQAYGGKRVRIGNTDAEGRLVLADLMAHLMEVESSSENTVMYSIATLTGHAPRAVGPYTALVENGAARAQQLSVQQSYTGDQWADPAEISRSRREDFDFIRGHSQADDVLSCNNAASSVTARGHQFPMAFLAEVGNVENHIPYVHVDIAGSGVHGSNWQHGSPSGTPVIALSAMWLKDN